MRTRDVRLRFWEKVKKTKGCWLWTASTGTMGYGQIGNRGKMWKAHQLSWVLHRGPIPKGLCVCHECDNPLCVRPKHLFLGTRKQNSEDMVRKGRNPIGEDKHSAILTEEDVVDIIKWKPRSQLTIVQLAAIKGVSVRTVSKIRRGEKWKHVYQRLNY